MRKLQRPAASVERPEACGLALHSRPSTVDRQAATLSEILIALMVMSIGVVSLATLFPASMIRALQANQLTNSTILRMNAEQLIGLFPRLVHDPDFDGNRYEHENQSNDPLFPGVDNPFNTGVGGDGVNEGRFIVDPVGWNAPAYNVDFTPAATPLKLRDVFGNNNGASGPIPTNPLRRYHGGFTTSTVANALAYLPDNWQMAAKGNVTAATLTDITVPAGTDLLTAQQALSATTPIPVRVVLISANGRRSITRTLTAATMINTATNVIDWSTLVPAQPLPTGFTVARFRLEIYDPKYTWLLTVRKSPSAGIPSALNPGGQGNANVDVVVFHKRAFSAANEQAFSVTSWVGNDCTLNLATAPAGTKAFLKKGGFLFDPKNAHWYRISQVKNETTQTPVVSLERPLIAGANNGTIVQPTSVLAMPGVVDVYSINTVPYNASNPP